MPKKSVDYTPYIFSIVFTFASVAVRNSPSQEGIVFRSVIYAIALLGLWRLIEWLLTLSEKKLVKLAYVIVGVNIYNMIYIGLDYYILHQITFFSGLQPWDLVKALFLIGVSMTLVIESVNWTKARENAQMENLRLQAENIENKFALLKEQVNPDFLFYCLRNLQKMINSNDPKAEHYILKMADVYRQILKKERNLVPLNQDLEILKTYLFLTSYGRETMMQYDISVLEESLNYKLPVFALQMVVDKCLKDNDFSNENPLYIMIFQKDAHSITVSNNYQQKTGFSKLEQLEMRYALEGAENGVLVETESSTYSTTLKLF